MPSSTHSPRRRATSAAGNQRRARRIRVAALTAFALGMTACGEVTLDDRLAHYRSEVARVLEVEDTNREAAPEVLALPGRRHRRMIPADLRMNVFDFLAIQGCELSELVGERNSAMGKQMVPSRRLIYELRVLEAADACLASLSDARQQKLGAMIERKRPEVALHVWNAVWLGEEIEAYLAGAAHPFAISAGHDGTADVRRATRLLSQGIATAAEARELETALGGLLRAEPAGPILRGLDVIARELGAVARWMEAFETDACRGDAVRLRGVFESSYMPLQAQLAAFDANARERIEALDALYERTSAVGPAPSSEMADYHARRLDPDSAAGLWMGYRQAILRHVAAWEPTLRSCGVIPGRESA